ncbi:gluconate 2-dehydrogenase subunit 3 family protein [Paraglaciecola sp.]|uniref:twin-arginine translocation signal domain-containing protein n=1 Tax=Paraglaciecola sp. TaxID=1920173 RepID=UPI0030F3B671
MSNFMLSRRGFLKTASGAALLLVGYQAAKIWLDGDDENYLPFLEGEVPQALSIKEFAVLSSVVQCIVGVASFATVSTAEARTAARIDLELLHQGGKLLQDIKDSLLVVEFGTYLEGHGKRFTQLSTEQQHRFLLNLKESSITLQRQVYSGLRFLTVFFYYSDERTWPTLGYQSPWQPIKFYEGGNRIENLPPLSTALKESSLIKEDSK